MAHVIVDSRFVNYIHRGNGPVLLLLHGWGASSNSFSSLIQHLEKHWTVIAPDIPGFGESESPDLPWGLPEMADWLKCFCKKIDIKPEVIAGHSNGGALAIVSISKKLIIPKKLILLASAGVRKKRSSKKQLYKLVSKIGKTVTYPLPKKTKSKIRGKLYEAAGSEMLLVPHLEETFKKVVAYDVQADASQLNLSTLIIYGEDDTATPPKDGEVLHTLIKDSELYVIPSAGHYVFNDQTIKTYNLIFEFLGIKKSR